MLRGLRKLPLQRYYFQAHVQTCTFLTNEYQCTDAWNSETLNSLPNDVNIVDFYNLVEQSHSSKGVISAIDVDLFANALKDPVYLEELKVLLNKLRLSAETYNTLESTHHATIRKFIEFEHISELVDILKDPLNFGLFLDDYTANILLDKLLGIPNYKLAADVASLIMLQEEYTNDITCAFCQYAAYKYISECNPPLPPDVAAPVVKSKKVEEFKIRVKYLRNPYFDDHFDIKDIFVASGKTLAWISEQISDNLNINLRVIGWLAYKKYDKMLESCKRLDKENAKVYKEVLDMLQKRRKIEKEMKGTFDSCISLLSKCNLSDISIEDSLKNRIENAINKTQNKDISHQKELFKLWSSIRHRKLEEQTKRLDRAKRMQIIQDKQKALSEQEQRLWFFENAESIDLKIEEKEKLVDTTDKKGKSGTNDENYIPPEILPKRR